VLLKCRNCNFKKWIKDPSASVGRQITIASLLAGSSHGQTEKLLVMANIKAMTFKTYNKQQSEMDAAITEELRLEMAENMRAEKEIAIKLGHVRNGIPYLTVKVDGAYSQHCFNRYNSRHCWVSTK
jgi:hypothetical protein